MDFDKVGFDYEWADSRRGEVRGNYVWFDIPCKYLTEDNLCERQDVKPQYCRDWPQNMGPLDWILALGCKFFDE